MSVEVESQTDLSKLLTVAVTMKLLTQAEADHWLNESPDRFVSGEQNHRRAEILRLVAQRQEGEHRVA